FLGPSLPRHKAAQILNAQYYPPASKGDIYRIITSGVKAIILIDGIFHSKPSIWHRELIHAMEEGIQVFGASSMGALRASELEAVGMVGYGKVFEWYRDGVIEGDDEVALIHGIEESNFIAMSEPLVNIRYTLLKCVEENCLTVEQAEDFIAEAKQLYYPQRSYHHLIQSPLIEKLPLQQAYKLKQYLQDNQINIKQLDTIGLLKLYASLGENTTVGQKQCLCYPSIDLQFERSKMTGFIGHQGVKTGKDILQMLKQDVELQDRMRSQLSKRCFLLTWARQNQICVSPLQWHSYQEQWQQKYGILKKPQWLQSNGLTTLGYEEILKDYCLVDWIVNQGPNYFGISWNYQTALNVELRLTGNVPSDENLWEQLSARCFIVQWSKQNGIVCPESELKSYLETWSTVNSLINQEEDQVWLEEKALETWIVNKQPDYFGISWSFPLALFQECQITGKSAQMLLV
ncbi:MAG: TfuA-like protein, partial [Sphaerospermopsis kisseleviana]